MNALHKRAFPVTVVWTLILLFLGSVVHATESSLACPDWPTCFGTMVPEMSGGVFWEHLHRLVAGGLLLMWALATWLVRKEAPEHPWLFKACVAGLVLLLIQSVFGGITVLMRLPDLVSTSHLSLALIFLSLATALASRVSWTADAEPLPGHIARRLRIVGGAAVGLVFVQCVVGGLVRHMDAGMACPDAPLCLGAVVPPLGNGLVAVHFLHRVTGVLAALVVIGLAVWSMKAHAPKAVRAWASWAAVLVLLQVALGFVSVLTSLAVVPVSLHTLVAASLLVVLVHVTTFGWLPSRPDPVAQATE